MEQDAYAKISHKTGITSDVAVNSIRTVSEMVLAGADQDEFLELTISCCSNNTGGIHQIWPNER